MLSRLIYIKALGREEKIKALFEVNYAFLVYGSCLLSAVLHSYFWFDSLPVNGMVFFVIHLVNALVFSFVRINYGIGYSMGYHFLYNIPYFLPRAMFFLLTEQ
jgi:hypothetical protein